MTSRCSLDTIWRANWNIHNMEGRVIPSIYNTEGWAGARGKKIGGTLLTKERSKMPRLEEMKRKMLYRQNFQKSTLC